VVGDGEAETGPLATAWHSNKFINPIRDGAVLPILNLNGYKIANPTILARISHEELEALVPRLRLHAVLRGGRRSRHHAPEAWRPRWKLRSRDSRVQQQARTSGIAERPRWPMIVLRSPKGWTGPKEVNGHQAEGSWRSHQVPFSDVRTIPRICNSCRTGCRVIARRNCLMPMAGCGRSCAHLPPAARGA
jgi:xylulose-5-phosphate/fructose-6-phosphate phosphoketolase